MKLKTYGDKTRSIGKLETLVRMGNIVARTLSSEYKSEGDFFVETKANRNLIAPPLSQA